MKNSMNSAWSVIYLAIKGQRPAITKLAASPSISVNPDVNIKVAVYLIWKRPAVKSWVNFMAISVHYRGWWSLNTTLYCIIIYRKEHSSMWAAKKENRYLKSEIITSTFITLVLTYFDCLCLTWVVEFALLEVSESPKSFFWTPADP